MSFPEDTRFTVLNSERLVAVLEHSAGAPYGQLYTGCRWQPRDSARATCCYVQSRMYVTGVTCSACHDVHGTGHAADLIAPGNAVCTACHRPELQPGPAGSLEYHTRHRADSEGSACAVEPRDS